MKKIIIAVLLIGFIVTFVLSSPFKNDFDFNGTTYSHIKKMSGGEIINHFYTPNGEELNAAKDFIQILEVSDKIQKDDWQNRFKPLYNQYNLKPVEDTDFDLSGRGQKAGMYYNSYATLITVKGKEHMAFYINTTNAEQDEESDSQKIDIIYELKIIKLD